MVWYHAADYADTVEDEKDVEGVCVAEIGSDDVAAVRSEVIKAEEDGPKIL
jgi:hypothetical protein